MSANKKKMRQNFRDTCFIRDSYSCVMCGVKSSPEKALEDLDCHHITDRSLIINQGYVSQNGITLCKPCHIKAEEFNSTGVAVSGYHPDDLYKKIGSSLEKAMEESKKI